MAELAGRISGSGPPNIFTTLGRHPRLFRAWLRYSAHLMPFGQLPRRDTELVILRVAWQCRSAYEWQQHVPIALRVGLTPDEVAGVADDPAAGGFTERQRALLAVSDELLAERSALGCDVERRPGESPRPRGDRIVPAHRQLPRAGVHDRRTRHPSRTGSRTAGLIRGLPPDGTVVLHAGVGTRADDSAGAACWAVRRTRRTPRGGCAMAVAEQTTVYPAPGSPGSPVSLKPRYENFIGGHWVAPVEGAYSRESESRHGRAVLRGRALDRRRTSSSRSTPRTRRARRGARPRRPSAPRS